MDPSREERVQQRLRGAQKRQVKDVDFGFIFPPVLAQPTAAPTSVRRSPRRSLEAAPPLSARPTPANRSRSQPPDATPADEKTRPAATHNTFDANISAKRRKLDTDVSSSQRSTRSSKLVPRRDVYALPVEEESAAAEDVSVNSIEQIAPATQAIEPDTSTSFVPETMERTPSPTIMQEEITESPSHAPGSGHRTRTFIPSASKIHQNEDELQMNSTLPIEHPASPTPKIKRKRASSIADTIRSRQSQSRNSNHPGDDADELSPEQPRRGRRRRSSMQRESASGVAVEEEEIAEEIEDAEAAHVLQKNRRRVTARQAHTEPSPDLDEPSKQPPVKAKDRRKHQNTISSPAKQKHPKKAPSKAAGKLSREADKKQARAGGSIPVTVYRFTEAPVYDEDESDADILNAENPYARRGNENAIDVLTQLCQEAINSSLETIQDLRMKAPDNASKREFRDKHRYVQAYGRELEARLLDHTINLGNNASLTKRLREEKRKRVALREELSQIKAQREQVNLRMDEIRIRHESESKDAQERDTLNTAIYDIELAAERGKENNPHDPANGPVEKNGTELLLRRIANEVSNKSDSGGMLKQIEDFNAFLERAATALESRKA